MASKAKLNKWLEFIIIIICFMAPMSVAVPWKWLKHSGDFSQCYATSYLMHTGSYSLIYNNTFSIPPIISWIFAPLAWFRINLALGLWTANSIIFMLLSYFMLCQSLGIRGAKRLWVAAFLGALGPFIMAVWHEQLTPLLFFALTGLFIALKKRRPVQASIYQFLLWLKPYLLIPIIVYELGAGQSNLVIITFLLAIIGLLLSCVLGGLPLLGNYWHLCMSYKMETSLLSIFQAFVLPNRALRFFIPIDLYSAISIAIYLFLLIAAFFIGKQVRAKKLPLTVTLTSIVPLTLCLFSPSLDYDVLLIVPGILLLAVSNIDGWLKYLKILLILAIFGFLFLPDYLIIHSMSISRSGIFSPFFWGSLAFALGALIIERQQVEHNVTSIDAV